MTLLIACICIYAFHLPSWWYGVAVPVWILHLLYHDGGTK